MTHRNKYTPEQVQLAMDTIARYTDAIGTVRWSQLQAENPELMVVFNNDRRRIEQLYRRKVSPKPKARSPRTLSHFTDPDLRLIRKLALKRRGTRLNWAALSASGQLADLPARYPLKKIKERYSYESKKMGKSPQPAADFREEEEVNNESPSVLAARKAEIDRHVNAVALAASAAREATTVNYCPHCGYHLAKLNA